MKLLYKINLRFLVLLLVVFSIAGVVLYFWLGFVVEDNLDEVLRNRADKVVQTLKNNPKLAEQSLSLDQSITITKVLLLQPKRIFSDTTVFDSHEHENIECRKITFTDSVDSINYKISIVLSRLETEDTIEMIFYFMLALFILIVFVLFLLNQKMSSTLWLPFFNTLNQLKTFKIGQKNQIRLKKTNILEFQQLNKELSELLQKLETDYRNLKEFTENASHEIQTPLAVIKSKIENILQDRTLNQDQYKQLHIIFESTARLSKLNETLLLLSKIENLQFSETSTIDLCHMTIEKLDFIQELLSLKSIHVTLEIHGSMLARINPYLADILISNLLGNALKHTDENGEIHLSGNENQLIFSNTGNPLIIDPEKIFQRFVKQNTSSNESMGLGLSIAAEICKNFQLDLSYNYKNGYHCFCLSKKNQISIH